MWPWRKKDPIVPVRAPQDAREWAIYCNQMAGHLNFALVEATKIGVKLTPQLVYDQTNDCYQVTLVERPDQ